MSKQTATILLVLNECAKTELLVSLQRRTHAQLTNITAVSNPRQGSGVCTYMRIFLSNVFYPP